MDLLFGRRGTSPSKSEPLSALATAHFALREHYQLRPREVAGICLRLLPSVSLEQTKQDLDNLFQSGESPAQVRYRLHQDEHGYLWLLLEDPDFERLVRTVRMVSFTVEANGHADRLLAAVFRFQEEEGGGSAPNVYWVYSYQRGKFYPFVPIGSGEQRDNGYELRLGAALASGLGLPVEKDKAHWYPLWDLPL